jgi:bifunctional DNA-binding transcriptional regulator/antitoxin component of YhaV-PrlF toxin-antitoxin module
MITFMSMKQLKITRGGQVSIPAEIRHRWRTSRLSLDDRCDEIVLRPAPDDPIQALKGALRLGEGLTSDDVRRIEREEEARDSAS